MSQFVRPESQRLSTTEKTSELAVRETDIPLARQCGLLRFGRLHGKYTVLHRPRCRRRRCTVCLPHVINKKMARVPEVVVYGQITTAAKFAKGLRQQLERARKRGEDGDYMRIPVSADQILVVSDAEIGYPIDKTIVAQYMTHARPEWGSITSSKDWRALKSCPPNGFEDEGVATASVAKIVRKAASLNLTPIETAHSLAYRTTDAQHQAWKFLAKVYTDAEYWERVRTPSGDWLAA